MTDDEVPLAVLAHRLMGELSVVDELLAGARRHLEINSVENAHTAKLLASCDQRLSSILANVARFTTAGCAGEDCWQQKIGLPPPTRSYRSISCAGGMSAMMTSAAAGGERRCPQPSRPLEGELRCPPLRR